MELKDSFKKHFLDSDMEEVEEIMSELAGYVENLQLSYEKQMFTEMRIYLGQINVSVEELIKLNYAKRKMENWIMDQVNDGYTIDDIYKAIESAKE